MNDLSMYVIAALFIAAWVVYFSCGLLKVWVRLGEYPLIDKYMKRKNLDYFWLGILLMVATVYTFVGGALLYKYEFLHIALFAILSVIAIMFAPRFIIDVCRGLKYNAKTGELERLKELEKNNK
tara:strand:+ start:79 stop:450 length:372 start_codon:yes stop_codon:yes gene_type:complete